MRHDGPMTGVTLQTIADQLGVSRTTISNAYNRPDQLGEELRERILATAAELGYHGPDAAGRLLRTGRTGSIGLLFTDDLRFVFTDPDTSRFMRGVAETSALAGTGLTLLPVPHGLELAQTAVPAAVVDGYLVFSVADGHPALEWILRRGGPVVVVDEPDLGDAASFVGIDDRAGAAMAAEHLLTLGHRRIGVLFGRLDDAARAGRVSRALVHKSTIRIARARMAGYEDGLTAAGLEPDGLITWQSGSNDPDAGRRATLELLDEHPEVTAILCFTDQLAIGATQAGVRSGRRVPEQLSVVGFDDVPRAATWDPPLTTIRQPLVDKGRVAADLLLQQIADGGRGRIELPIELVVRGSTAAPPG
jgi:DNA-binding LacI/PurR family transcriptional regulator